MPPGRNQRGGKGYKKGKKKPVEDEDKTLEFPAGRFDKANSEWQDYGRVLRLLGDRRVLCFCNDGAERVCKIRGALCKGPKRKKIEIGDIVAVSYRAYVDGAAADETDDSAEEDEEEVAAVTTLHRSATTTTAAATEMTPTATAAMLDSGRKDVADIVEKYDSRNWRHIRKEGGLHPHLFGSGSATTGGGSAAAEEDDIFESRDEAAVASEGSDDEMDDDDIDAI